MTLGETETGPFFLEAGWPKYESQSGTRLSPALERVGRARQRLFHALEMLDHVRHLGDKSRKGWEFAENCIDAAGSSAMELQRALSALGVDIQAERSGRE